MFLAKQELINDHLHRQGCVACPGVEVYQPVSLDDDVAQSRKELTVWVLSRRTGNNDPCFGTRNARAIGTDVVQNIREGKGTLLLHEGVEITRSR